MVSTLSLRILRDALTQIKMLLKEFSLIFRRMLSAIARQIPDPKYNEIRVTVTGRSFTTQYVSASWRFRGHLYRPATSILMRRASHSWKPSAFPALDPRIASAECAVRLELNVGNTILYQLLAARTFESNSKKALIVIRYNIFPSNFAGIVACQG